MERLVTKAGGSGPAVPTEIDMDFAFDIDRETFEGLQRIFNQLCAVTDIMGDDYDLDRLRELIEADRDGRIEIKAKARKCPKCGKFKLYPRIDWEYYYCFNCKTQFTKEEAEAALRRMKDG